MTSTRSTTLTGSTDSSDDDEYFDAFADKKEGTLDILYRVNWTAGKEAGWYESEEDPLPATKIYRPPSPKPRSVISVFIIDNGVFTSAQNDNSATTLQPPPLYRPPQPSIITANNNNQRGMPMINAPAFPIRPSVQNQLRIETSMAHPSADFKTVSMYIQEIHINSPHVVQAMRKLVQYRPALKVVGSSIVVSKPYALLFHYYHDLKNLRDVHKKKGTENSTDEEVAHDLTVLLDWLEPHYINVVRKEEERHQRGVATSDNFWLLYKPGCTVYAKLEENWRAFIVHDVNNDVRYSMNYSWTIETWYLSYHRGRFARKKRGFPFFGFDGERKIMSLELVPKQYLDDEQERAALLELRGSRYHDIMRSLPCHLRYHGEAITRTGSERKYEGEIIVDPESWGISPVKSRRRSRHLIGSDSDSDSDNQADDYSDDELSESLEHDYYQYTDVDNGERRSDRGDIYDSIADWKRLQFSPVENAELSEHQKTLLPTHLRAFALRNKS